MNIGKVIQIAWRDFTTTVMTKGFIISLLIAPLLMLVISVLMPLLLSIKPKPVTGDIWVFDPTAQVLQSLRVALSPEGFAQRRVELEGQLTAVMPTQVKGVLGKSDSAELAMAHVLGEVPTFTIKEVASEAQLAEVKQALIDKGNALAVLAIHPNAVHLREGETRLGSYDFFVRKGFDDRLRDELRDAVKNALVNARFADSSMKASQALQLIHVPRVSAQELSEQGDSKSAVTERVLPIAFMMLIFVAAMVGGQQLMTSTIEEKSSRVVEVLLSAVSPTELMTGKILGQMAVSLVVFALYGSVGLLALLSFTALGFINPWLLFYCMVFFLIAYITVASLMTAIGAAVNELREAQSLLMPVMLILCAPMMLWVPISRAPDSMFAVILSFTPPVNSFFMLLRLGSSVPPPTWQVWVSMGLGVVSAVVAVWLADKVFRVGLLMHGKPPSLRTLWQWVRMS